MHRAAQTGVGQSLYAIARQAESTLPGMAILPERSLAHRP